MKYVLIFRVFRELYSKNFILESMCISYIFKIAKKQNMYGFSFF